MMLLDTSGLLCLLHNAEAFHELACHLYDAAPVRITHSYILAEFIALANARGLPRSDALDFVRDTLDDAAVETIWVDESLSRRALALFWRRSDKSYSLCDGVSFELMRDRHIVEALTTDRHFKQEGFSRLLE